MHRVDLERADASKIFNVDGRVNGSSLLLVNIVALCLGNEDVLHGDGIENSLSAALIEARKSNSVLIIRSVNLGDVNIFNAVAEGEQTNGTMAIGCIQTADADVGDRSEGALVRIECNEIVIASALQVLDRTVMAVSVEVDAVHIDGDGVAVVEIEEDISDREIFRAVDADRIVGGVLDGQRGHLEVLEP